MPEAELRRRFDQAVERRVPDLVAPRVPRRDARRQAKKEFAVYDELEIDARGWVRLTGFDASGALPRNALLPKEADLLQKKVLRSGVFTPDNLG